MGKKLLTWVSTNTALVCYASRRQAIQQAPEGALIYAHDAERGGPSPRPLAVVHNGKAVP
jgi:hypothetical protein